MKKFLLPLLLVVAGVLTSCGGSNAQLGKKIDEQEFQRRVEQAEKLKEQMNISEIVAKGSLKSTANNIDMSLDCTLTEEIMESGNLSQAQAAVAAVVEGYTYSYATDQFKRVKQMYEPLGAKLDLNYFYDETTENLGLDAKFTFNQKAGGTYANQSLIGTYQWTKYGVLAFCEETSKFETNAPGAVNTENYLKLEITYK